MDGDLMSSFYSEAELCDLGLKHYGKNVLISKKASIYGSQNIKIGDNVRIDDFCILSGNIKIGNYVHISAYAGLFAGKSGIYIEDFVAISSRVIVYAVTDDYSGAVMTNPMVPSKYKNVEDLKVIIGKHSIIGSGSTILPGVQLSEGSAVGAMSLVNQSTEPWSINVGIPARKIKERKRELLELEKAFLEEEQNKSCL